LVRKWDEAAGDACDGCGATVGRWAASPLCPACHPIAGATLPLPAQRRPGSATWLLDLRHSAGRAGPLGHPTLFDHAMHDARQLIEATPGAGLVSPYTLHEVHLRGLVRTGRAKLASTLLDRHRTSTTTSTDTIPPQWQAILQATIGEVLLTPRRHSRIPIPNAADDQ